MRIHVFVGEDDQVITTTPVPEAGTQSDIVFAKSTPPASRVNFKAFEVDTSLDLKIADKDLPDSNLHLRLSEYIRVGKNLRPAQ